MGIMQIICLDNLCHSFCCDRDRWSFQGCQNRHDRSYLFMYVDKKFFCPVIFYFYPLVSRSLLWRHELSSSRSTTNKTAWKSCPSHRKIRFLSSTKDETKLHSSPTTISSPPLINGYSTLLKWMGSMNVFVHRVAS